MSPGAGCSDPRDSLVSLELQAEGPDSTLPYCLVSAFGAVGAQRHLRVGLAVGHVGRGPPLWAPRARLLEHLLGSLGHPGRALLDATFVSHPACGTQGSVAVGTSGASASGTGAPTPPSLPPGQSPTHRPPPGSSWVEGRAFWPGTPSCVGDGGSMRWNMRGVRFWGGREEGVCTGCGGLWRGH